MSSAKQIQQSVPAWMIGLLLVCLTVGAYWPVSKCGFVNFDDPVFVPNNPMVRQGFTASGVAWAFTTTETANWHPLTWFSHMLDCQLFGVNPGPHHLSSVFLHAANCLLLFFLLLRLTGAKWRSAFVAALFGLHPMHVESVAWIAERKDMLSTFFGLLSVGAYVRYVQKLKVQGSKFKAAPDSPIRRLADSPILWYFLTLLCFVLGLMSKPMLVTLPFVLLLLDWWPLRRWTFPLPTHGRAVLPHCLLEKLPFLLLAAADCFITVHAQHGAFSSLQEISFGLRLENALVAYASYAGKLFWPVNMVIMYLHGDSFPAGELVGSALLLGTVSVLALWQMGRRPWLAFGWVWFLGTLVPVIGLVQVGLQAMADRYTYFPYIGLSIMVAWGAHELAVKWPRTRIALAGAGGLALAVCVIVTRGQITYWQDGISLFTHAVQATRDNHVAHHYLGIAYEEQRQPDRAAQEYQEALRIKPDFGPAHYNLGTMQADLGQLAEAEIHLRAATRLNPQFALAFNNLGRVYALQNKIAEAEPLFAEAIKLDPRCEPAHINMGIAYGLKGQLEQSVAEFQTAVELAPEDQAAQAKLADARERLRRAKGP